MYKNELQYLLIIFIPALSITSFISCLIVSIDLLTAVVHDPQYTHLAHSTHGHPSTEV